MKHKNYITDKKLRDRRFRKTEDAIIEIFLKNPTATTVKISQSIHISRTTFYRHHHAPSFIADDYEKYLRRKFKSYLRPFLSNKRTPYDKLWLLTSIFIIQNKKYFQVIIKSHGSTGFYFLLEILRPRFEKYAHFSHERSDVFRIYCGEVSAILYDWFERNFSDTYQPTVLQNIKIISAAAHHHLSPITH